MRFVLSVLVVSLMSPAAAALAQPPGSTTLARSGIAAGRGCATFPTSRLRVRLSLSESQVGDPRPVIRDVVSETWSRQGLSIDWVEDPPGSAPTWDGVDAWISLRHAPADRRQAKALGGAVFVDGVPSGLVFVSIDATRVWLHTEQARQLGLQAKDYPPLILGETSAALYATLGHVVAHEIGHVVLGTRDHGPHGLMKAAYDDVETLSRPEALPLDGRNRARLFARLNASAACQALNASNQARPRTGRDQ
jgi:hypothetical protein